MDEKKRKNKTHEDEEIIDNVADEIEIEDIDDRTNAKVKQLQEKLRHCEEEKLKQLEELQRAKAEFLNSKRRIEDDRLRDRERAIVKHVEKLLPLYDSFHMAMSNKEQWESVDAGWRKGIESIQNQLQTILSSYNVSPVDTVQVPFDPEIHEAIDHVNVDNKELHDKVINIVQVGFTRQSDEKQELVRPARAIIGKYSDE